MIKEINIFFGLDTVMSIILSSRVEQINIFNNDVCKKNKKNSKNYASMDK